MARSTKESWLKGPGDLREAEVEDVPVKGESVHVRGLPAAYSNDAQSEATEVVAAPDGSQKVVVNATRLEAIQFAHGVIDPVFSVEEAQQVAERYGPAFRKVIAEIDRLSGVDKDAIKEAEARFPGSGGDEAGGSGPEASGDNDGDGASA